MSRLFRISLTFLATFFALTAIALGFVSWKMAARPLSSHELTPYIEAALARFVPGGHAKIEKTNLSWDNREHTLALDCEGLQIFGPSGAAVSRFPSVNLKIGIWSFLRGRLLPIEMKADNAQFWLTRRKDGQWMIGGAAASNGQSSGSSLDIFSVLQETGDEIANVLLRHKIQIKEAVWFVHDETIGKDWSLTAREITLNHEGKEAQGAARVEVAQGAHTSYLDARYRYERADKLHRLDVSFQDINLFALASQHPKLAALSFLDMPLTGSVSIGTDRELNLSASAVKIKGSEGALSSADLWENRLPAKEMDLVAHYDPAKGAIVLDNLSFLLGETKLAVKGTAQVPLNDDSLWAHPRRDGSFSAEVTVENLPMDRFKDIWPKTAVPDARLWIVANMSRGKFDYGQAHFKGKIDWNDLAKTEVLSGGGKIAASRGRITYLEGMPAIDDASAEATFDLKHMDVKILSGHTGDIRVLPFTLTMTDFENDTQYITIPVRITGPTPAILTLLDSKPLGYAKAIGLKPADTEGSAEGTLTLHMPMLDALLLKDVEYKAEAKFKNFGLRNKIPHITVSDGALDFRLGADGFELDGPVSLNKVPLALKWKSRFDAAATGAPLHEATVQGTIKENGWAAFGLEKAIKTEGPSSIVARYENKRDGFSTLAADLDFKESGLRIPVFSLVKPRGVAATIALEAELLDGKNADIRKFELTGKGLNVKGTAEMDSKTGDIRRANLAPYVVGRSNASVTYVDDLSGAFSLTVTGKTLDISGLDEADDEKAEEQKAKAQEAEKPRFKTYKIKLAKLYSSKNGFLTDVSFEARRDKQGWKDISFDAMAQGEVPVIASLKPEGKILRLSASSDDFGKALRGLGLTDTVEGGQLSIVGESAADDPRAIVGKIKVSSFTVSGLPVLARLLSAVSPFGFMDLITGDASFDHLRGYYKWQGDRIEINKMRAAGSVVGINLDGHIDSAQDQVSLSGTLVPFSFVNSVIGSIPLLGDVITGGSGQGVIAASFTVRGPTDNLDVSVNPVSLLTPGFLRNLFFAGEDNGETGDSEEDE